MESPTSQDYLDTMLDWNEEEPDKNKLIKESEICKFYDGCIVLVTGGSGFMGKLLVEKLLR